MLKLPPETATFRDGVSPGPQSTSMVCVSWVPTSLYVPVSVTVPFSSIVGVTPSKSSEGATLLTVTLVSALAEPVSSSVTVALMV